jgi:hypothetical protein
MQRTTRWALATTAVLSSVGVGVAVATGGAAALVAGGSGGASEPASPTSEPPYAEFAGVPDLTGVEFTDNGDGTGTLQFTLDGETVTVQVGREPGEGGGLRHGDVVRSFEESITEHPGRGCLVSAVATLDFGLRGADAEPPSAAQGCPDGLRAWLQTFAEQGADDGGTREGPPPFVTPGGPPADAGPPEGAGPPADTGPPEGAGPPADSGPPEGAGPPADSGPPEGAGPPADAGPPEDAGPPAGAGGPPAGVGAPGR